MYNIGFIIEQALGHVTHTKNLRINVPKDKTISPTWMLPEWQRTGWRSKIPVYNNNWTLQAGLQTRQMLAQNAPQSKFDVLFFHTQITAVLAQDWLQKIPSVVSLDATPIQYDALGASYNHEPGPDWLENWKWRLNRDCYRKARHLVVWSEWVKNSLVGDYEVPADKITVIPPGVNVAEWTYPTQRQYHHSGPVKILFVGGNFARKGGHELLAAFRTIRDRMWALPGSGSQTAVELHIVTRDKVETEPGVYVYNNMKANMPELKQLYFDCDIFCMPTYGDTIPLVYSEASASGMAVIGSDIAAISEILVEDETGYVVTPGAVEQITAVIERLVLDPNLRMRIGQAAHQRVAKRFDAPSNTIKLLNLLKDVADNK